MKSKIHNPQSSILNLAPPLFTMVQFNDAHLTAVKDDSNNVGKFRAVLDEAFSGRRHAKPNILLLAGDMIDEPIDENYALLNQVLAPVAGITQLVAAGNHEVGSSGDQTAIARFDRLFGTRELTAAHLYRGVLFVVLYNSDGDLDPTPARERRNRWLEKTLNQNQDKPIVVVAHVPLVPMRDPFVLASSFDYATWVSLDLDQTLLRILERHHENVIAVLSGHLHLTAHVEREGLHFIVPSGTMSWPHDYALFEFYPDRVRVRMLGPEPPPEPGKFAAMDLHNGIHDRHGAGIKFTDARHPTFESYVTGTPEEREFSIPVRKGIM